MRAHIAGDRLVQVDHRDHREPRILGEMRQRGEHAADVLRLVRVDSDWQVGGQRVDDHQPRADLADTPLELGQVIGQPEIAGDPVTSHLRDVYAGEVRAGSEQTREDHRTRVILRGGDHDVDG